MVVDKVPLLMQMLEQRLEEEQGILLGQSQQQLGDLGIEVMLVDHFIEVPQSEEQRFDDIGEEVFLLDGAGAEEDLKLIQDVVHGCRHLVRGWVRI
jgi:hypothetical protein